MSVDVYVQSGISITVTPQASPTYVVGTLPVLIEGGGATAVNLAATGAFLQSEIVAISGATGVFITTGQTGAFYAATNPSQFISTGNGDIRYALATDTGSFITTGLTGQFAAIIHVHSQYVNTGNTGNFITTFQTGQFYSNSNPSGFITSGQTGVFSNADTLDNQHSSYFVNTGQTGVFALSSNTGNFVTTGDSRTLGFSGNVGIGTMSPLALLHIKNGNLRIENVSASYLDFYRGTQQTAQIWTDTSFMGIQPMEANGRLAFYSCNASGNQLRTVDIVNSNVGIGTIAPTSRLQIQGTGTTSGSSSLNVTDSSGTSLLFVNDSGNIGINTITPTTKLEVADTSTGTRGITSTQNNSNTHGAQINLRKSRNVLTSPLTIVTGDVLGRIVGFGHDGTNYLEMSAIEMVSMGTVADTRVPTKIVFKTATNAAPSVLTERMCILENGNVGIGTTTPTRKLDIVNTSAGATASMLSVSNLSGSASTGASIDYQLDTGWYPTSLIATRDINGYSTFNIQTYSTTDTTKASRLFINTAGNVGIGTTSPNVLLHIASGTTGLGVMNIEETGGFATGPSLDFRHARGTVAVPTVITTADVLGNIRFKGYGGAAGMIEAASIRGKSTGTIADSRVPGEIQFWTSTDAQPSVPTQRVVIDSAGNVGINTLTPSERLDIRSGSLRIYGSTTDNSAKLNLKTTNNEYYLQAEDSDFDGVGFYKAAPTGESVATGWKMALTNSGWLGIGTVTPGTILTVANDNYISSKDYAGTSFVNMFKTNTSDEIDVGATLNIPGYIEGPTDGGAITLFDMPVTSGSPTGAEMSATIKLGNLNIFKFYGQATGGSVSGANSVNTPSAYCYGPLYTSGVYVSGNPALTGGYVPWSSLACSITTVWNATPNVAEDRRTLSLTGSTTLNISGLYDGWAGVLQTTQVSSGFTLTLPAGTKVANNGSGALALTTGISGAIDMLSFMYNGTNLFANIANNWT